MGMFTDARMGRAMDMEDVALLVGEISNSIMRHPHALISLSRLKNSTNTPTCTPSRCAP